jgi:hypothetical protein
MQLGETRPISALQASQLRACVPGPEPGKLHRFFDSLVARRLAYLRVGGIKLLIEL